MISELRRAAPHRLLRQDRNNAENRALVLWAVRRFLRIRPGHPDYEDACAEGMLILHRAAMQWDHLMGMRFSTYAGRALMHSLLRWAARQWQHGFRGMGEARVGRPASLGDDLLAVLPGDDGAGGTDVDRGLRAADDAAGVERLLRLLRERDRAAVRARVVDGRTYRAIAADMGTSKQRVQQLVARGMETLRRHLDPPAPRVPPAAAPARHCAHCRAVLPNVGSRKYCRPGDGCKAACPARALTFGKAAHKFEVPGPDGGSGVG